MTGLATEMDLRMGVLKVRTARMRRELARAWVDHELTWVKRFIETVEAAEAVVAEYERGMGYGFPEGE